MASAVAPAVSSTAVDLAEHPVLIDEANEPLPQTEDKPSLSSPAFKMRLELLLAAIAADDPALAEAAFFPKLAYEKVKDIKNPGADWKSRLMKAFARDIHRYHKQLKERFGELTDLTLDGLEVDEARVKWMPRGKEGNRVGYYRVTRNKLRFKRGDQSHTLELTSLISWRGEWFIVHLNGFK